MKKRNFLLMLLAVSLFSACKDDKNIFIPESMQQQVSADATYPVNGYNINMIYVPEVLVQTKLDIDDNLKVVVQASYYMMQNEVTQGLFNSVMGYNPSSADFTGENLPVNYINLFQCREFTEKLNTNLGKRNYFRLPNSKEWVYAAQNGKKVGEYLYAGSDDINSVAWYKGNSGMHIHTVGLKAPNKLGLYDMSGNVSEWTDDTRYNADGTLNGDVTGNMYGGNFDVAENVCVVASTLASQSASNTHYTYGFRVAATASSVISLKLDEPTDISKPESFKWNITPLVAGNACNFKVSDSKTGDVNWNINLNLTSSDKTKDWEFFPSTEQGVYKNNYYVLEVGKDITGTVHKNVASKQDTYDIVSGFIGIKSGVVVVTFTIKSTTTGQLETIKGSRALVVNSFDISAIDAIYPELDKNDASGRTCNLKAFIKGQLHSTTEVVLLPSSSITKWNFYFDAAKSLTIGKDISVKTTMNDASAIAFTTGKMTLSTAGRIALSATGMYKGVACAVTSKAAKKVSTQEYNITGVQVKTVGPDNKLCVFDIAGNMLSIRLSDESKWVWDFNPTSDNLYSNYVVGIGISNGSITSSGVVGEIQYGSISFSEGIMNSSLIGWMNGVLTTIAGSQFVEVAP
ncbi:MAG: SUMF1/EgtB/PvdO family nonheme iron enzyme [Bacteroidales bacterium]